MKYNPLTKSLFSDSGRFLKKLSCPKVGQKLLLSEVGLHGRRLCSSCNKLVVDAAAISEADLEKLIDADSTTCISIPFNHDALEVVSHDPAIEP